MCLHILKIDKFYKLFINYQMKNETRQAIDKEVHDVINRRRNKKSHKTICGKQLLSNMSNDL